MLNLNTSKPNDFMGAVGAAFTGVSQVAAKVMKTPAARDVMMSMAVLSIGGLSGVTNSVDLLRVSNKTLDTLSAAPAHSQVAANNFAGPSRTAGPGTVSVSRKDYTNG